MADRNPIQDQIRILSLAEGFFGSNILFGLLKLGVFELIGEGARSSDDLAAELDCRPETLRRALRGGVAVKLLELVEGDRYRVAEAYRDVLVPSAPGYLGHWLLTLELFQKALSRLDEVVLSSKPAADLLEDFFAKGEEARQFTFAMHDYAAIRGRELAKFLSTEGCRTLLDVGCGPGTYAFHLAAVNPELEVTLVDAPSVLEVAREVEESFQLPNEVHYLGADALAEEVPGTFDLVLVSNTLHMLGEEQSRELVKRLYGNVAEGGSLVVQAQYLKDEGYGGRWPVFLDLVQMCLTEHGRNHAAGETRRWMEEAGFTDVEFCPMTLLNTNSFLRGYKR